MAISVGKDEGDFNVEPNVVPLVDIMLVLLIIFIITIPVMTHAVKIDLPRANNQPTVTKPENIDVTVDFDGQVYWNGNPIPRQDLLGYIMVEAVKDPSPRCTSAATAASATNTWLTCCSRCSAAA